MALPLLAIGAAQAGVGAVQKVGAGIQRRNAEKNFQNYDIPSGVDAMMEVMKSLSTQTEMPGSDLLRSRMDKTTAQGVETAQRTSESGGDVLGLLSQVYSNQLSNAQNKSIQDAQFYQQNRLRYANALETLGGYQTEKWKYKELYPYLQEMTAAGQLDAAGGANISGGIGNMIDVQAGKANMKWLDENQESWMNNKYPNPGAPFGRTRLQEYQLRNLKQPNPSEINTESLRTPFLPFGG